MIIAFQERLMFRKLYFGDLTIALLVGQDALLLA